VVDLQYLQLGGGPALDVGRLLADVGALSLGGPVASVWTPTVAVTGLVAVALALWTSAGRAPSPGAFRAAEGRPRLIFYGVVIVLPLVAALALRPPFLFPRYFLVSLVFVPMLLSSALAGAKRPYRLVALAALVVLNGWSWLTFVNDGRGHYAAAVRDMLAAAPGPVSVVSDHPFRTTTVLEFYDRRVDPERRVVLVDGPADFYVVSGDSGTPPASCAGCALLGEYPSTPLSGASWRVYRRAATDTAGSLRPLAASADALFRLERTEVEIPDVGPKVAADHHVPVPGEVVEHVVSDFDVGLDADERRAEAFDVEPRQRFRLPQFDVHVEEIDARHAFGSQQVVERDGRNLPAVRSLAGPAHILRHSGRHPIVSVRAVEANLLIGYVRHEVRAEPGSRAVAGVVVGKFDERFDGDAFPTQLDVEVVGVAALSVVVRTDVEKEAGGAVLEEVPNQPFLRPLRVSCRPERLPEGGKLGELAFAEARSDEGVRSKAHCCREQADQQDLERIEVCSACAGQAGAPFTRARGPSVGRSRYGVASGAKYRFQMSARR
jgi:hypothetical protein